VKRVAHILVGILFFSLMTAGVSLAQSDVPGSKDHPLFNRMPGYHIHHYEDKEFDTHSFWDDAQNEIKVEGHFYAIGYALNPGVKEPSTLQILRNYENAVKKIGGTVLVSNWSGASFMKVTKEGKETWIHIVGHQPNEWMLYIVEKKGMVQDIVADAKSFSDDIKATGHTAIYGIYFDTGKSAIKPESEGALGEIAKLLKSDPGLKLHVVGHTDNVGVMEANVKLSQDRANAVVQALAGKHGIAGARLKASGVGPLAPVASNDTDEGKQKNRRVELVKQ